MSANKGPIEVTFTDLSIRASNFGIDENDPTFTSSEGITPTGIEEIDPVHTIVSGKEFREKIGVILSAFPYLPRRILSLSLDHDNLEEVGRNVRREGHFKGVVDLGSEVSQILDQTMEKLKTPEVKAQLADFRW